MTIFFLNIRIFLILFFLAPWPLWAVEPTDWNSVLRHVVYDASTGKGVGPFFQKIQTDELNLTIRNSSPLDEILFSRFLLELGRNLEQVRAPFKKISVEAMGTQSTIIKANIFLQDAAVLNKGDISEPEFLRRCGIAIIETLTSLKEKALAAHKAGQTDAVDALQKWIDALPENDPQTILPLSLLGNLLRQQNKYDDAIAVYQKLLTADPHSGFALNNIAYVYFQTGKWDLAIQNYQKFLEIEPDNIVVTKQLVELLRKTGAINGANTLLAKAKSLSQDPELFLLQGNLARDAQKYKEAAAAYAEGFKIAPQDFRFLFNQILVSLDQKDKVNAKKIYKELQTKSPSLASRLKEVDVLKE